MARPKGDGRGRIGGRAKGVVNKKDAVGQEAVHDIVMGNIDKIPEKLEMIVEPDKWMQYFLKLMEFVIPKKAAVQLSATKPLSDLKSELLDMAEKED